jgi:ABC-type multidrug transport system ATPase subunit
MPHKIELQNVGYKRIENGNTFYVLKGINLSINAGKKVFLIGINGIGKTTLVKILSGELLAEQYDVKTEMVVKVGAFTVAQGNSKKNRQASGVATVHQFVQDDLIDDLSVLKNIRIRQFFAGVKHRELVTADRLNSDFATYSVFRHIEPDRLVRNLSGGQKQLLNVLIALKYECGNVCRLLMLDEHLNALDVVAKDETELLINQFMTGVNKPTVITVTHNLEMAVKNSEMIIALKRDRTAICYDVQELLRSNNYDNSHAVHELRKIITE